MPSSTGRRPPKTSRLRHRPPARGRRLGNPARRRRRRRRRLRVSFRSLSSCLWWCRPCTTWSVLQCGAVSAPRIGWSSSLTWRPKRASHCAIIASIAASFAPISLRTCSTGRPFGCTLAGASSPAGTWPNLTTTNVSTCCAMDGFVASGVRGPAPSPILWSFRYRSDGVPAPPQTTFPADASSIARWTCLRRPTPGCFNLSRRESMFTAAGLERHVLSVNRTAPR